MNGEQLLIARMDDLRLRLASTEYYDLLRVAQILRQLMIDGDPLLEQVSRSRGLRCEFLPPPMSIDSVTPLQRRVRLDQILKFSLRRIGNQDCTVRSLIKYFANSRGGVHFGPPKGPAEEAIHNWLQQDENASKAASMDLREVGLLVLEGSRPLRYAVNNPDQYCGAVGLTLLLRVRWHPSDDQQQNYLLDLGTSRIRCRLSVYIDSRDELTIRFIGGDGRRTFVRVGGNGSAYRYGEWTTVVLQIAFARERLIAMAEGPAWDHFVSFGPDEYGGLPWPLILGSDVLGERESFFDLARWKLWNRWLGGSERDGALQEARSELDSSPNQYVQFNGHTSLCSQDHPRCKMRPPAAERRGAE